MGLAGLVCFIVRGWSVAEPVLLQGGSGAESPMTKRVAGQPMGRERLGENGCVGQMVTEDAQVVRLIIHIIGGFGVCVVVGFSRTLVIIGARIKDRSRVSGPDHQGLA